MRGQRLATAPVFFPKLAKFGGPYLPHHWSDWPKIGDLVLWVPKQHVHQVALTSETVGFKFSVILGDLTRNDPSVFLAFFSEVVPSPESFFRHSRGRLFTWPNHLSLAFLHLFVIFSTFSLSLMLSFLTWTLSMWPHACPSAHLHVGHFQFLRVGASDWHCLHRG